MCTKWIFILRIRLLLEMLFEICRWTKPQNYYLLKEQIFGNNQVKCTPHDRSSLYDSAAFVFCTDIFPFFIGQKCEQLKPVGISLWKYCLKRNYFTVKIKTDVENSWFYGNKQTKQCKSQITLSVCLMITKGQNVFFSVNWVEGQGFPFFSADQTHIFFCKTK